MDTPQVAGQITKLKNKNWNVRMNAIDALERIGDASAVPALIKALQDNIWQVRCRAASALKIGDASTIPYLIEALEDENGTVRNNAAVTLGRIGNASAVPHLITMLKDKGDMASWTRETVINAFVKIGGASTVLSLIKALKDTAQFVRQCAAEALGEIGDPSAIPALIEALKDKSSSIRVSAAKGLEKIGNSDTLPRKILADSRFSAQKRINDLESLRNIRYNENNTTLRYTFLETHALCQTVLNENDLKACEGAQSVLYWLDVGRYLPRASQPDTTSLPRVPDVPPEARSETLLRATDLPEKDVEPHPTLRERLFGKRN